MVSTEPGPIRPFPEQFRLIEKAREYYQTFLNASKYDYFIPKNAWANIPRPDPIFYEINKKPMIGRLLQQEKWKNVSILKTLLDANGHFPSNENNLIDIFFEKLFEDEFDYYYLDDYLGNYEDEYSNEEFRDRVNDIVLDILIAKVFYYGGNKVSAGQYLAYFMMDTNRESPNSYLFKRYCPLFFGSHWPYCPLSDKPQIDEWPLIDTLMELTYVLSKNKIVNVSILDLPSFGTMVKNFDTDDNSQGV